MSLTFSKYGDAKSTEDKDDEDEYRRIEYDEICSDLELILTVYSLVT